MPGHPAQGWREGSAEQPGPAFVAASRGLAPHGGAGEWKVPRWGRRTDGSTLCDVGDPWSLRLSILMLLDLKVLGNGV